MEKIVYNDPVKATNKLEVRIVDAFKAFDHDAGEMVDVRDVGAVLRSLGCVPTGEDIQQIVETTESTSRVGFVHLAQFMPYLIKMLGKNKMKPSPPEALLEAFKIFDPNGKGSIEGEKFKKLMKEVGESMDEEEFDRMMKSAIDPFDNVNYEVYLNQLMYEPEDSIYKLAEEFKPSSDTKKMKLF